MRFTIDEAARATGGSFSIDPVSDQTEITSLTWDSRSVEPGALYVALPGERVDGHAFAASAVAAGAACVLAQHELDQASADQIAAAGAAVIQVPDTQAAVTALARAWRDRLEGRVIGITGSTGKTTTKNLVRDVLAAAGSVCATKGNQNNELGVPNTVLAAQADTRNVIVEMGMRGLHQLEELCGFVRPQWGLVTNVGESHIELLGSRENIARAKAELLEALPTGGMAFVNAANDMTPKLLEFADLDSRGVTCVLYDGTAQAAERRAALSAADAARPAVWSEDVRLDAAGCPRFALCACGFDGMPEPVRVECALELRGMHNVSNACSAAAVGFAAGMEAAARVISEKYGCAVLCKGGHQINDADDLLWRDGCGKWFRGKRIANPNTHGTGCTLSSAIASNLAKGYDLDASVERAKAYISGCLSAMLDLGHGSGPMDHMFALKGEFVGE